MARLQKEVADQPDVVLVSFSVDPEHDTPEVLRDYAETYGADPKRWLFLTGKPKELYSLIRNSFHLAAEPAAASDRKPGQEVEHSTRLMLVDRQGRIRGMFAGNTVDESGAVVNDVPRLLERLRQLRGEKP
jgi:cytochrome oxidase Cu insertion factor (SCO1/SenC/PrrC family)